MRGVEAQDDRPIAGPQSRRQWLELAALLLAVFMAALFRLSTLIISEPDEGTYVYAGRLVAEGQAIYRDFMLAHPPGLMYFVAAVWKLAPGLMPVRIAYVLVVTLAWIPFYGLVRMVTRSHLAALAAVGLTVCGNLCAANMGRTVRLESLMLVLLFPCAWLVLARPTSAAWNAFAGVLFALATLIKLTSIFPIGFLFLADAVWPLGAQRVKRWASFAAGAALVLVPSWLVLAQVPGCIEWIFKAQAARPSAAISWRLVLLAQGFVRFPPFLLAFIAAALVLARPYSGTAPALRGGAAFSLRARALALAGLGTAVITAFAFKSYGRYYIVLAAPWCVPALVAMVEQYWPAKLARHLSKVWIATAIFSGVIAPAAYAEVIERWSAMHVLGPRKIVELLRDRPGYILTPVPDFAFFALSPRV